MRAVLSLLVATILLLMGLMVVLHTAAPLAPVSQDTGRAAYITEIDTDLGAAQKAGYLPQSVVTAAEANLSTLPTPTLVHILSSALSCVTGFTEAGAEVGAAAGAVLGAAIGAAIGYVSGVYDCQQSSAATGATSQIYSQMATIELGNELNATGYSLNTQLSALNTSANAFDYEAAHAALLQLPNSTFSVPLDMEQSGVSAQLAPFQGMPYAEVQSALRAFYHGYSTLESGNGPFAGTPTNITAGTRVVPTAGANFTSGVFETAAGAGPMYIVHGSEVTYASSQCGTFYWPFSPVPGTSTQASSMQFMAVGSVNSSNVNTPLCWASGYFPGATGEYYQNGSLTYLGAESYANGGIPQTYLGTTSGATAFTTIGLQGGYQYQLYPTPVEQNLPLYVYNLAYGAYTTAEAYWSFLHSLGYYSISSIPAGCYIPAPYQAIPPNLDMSGLSEQAIMTLYYGYLQGLANFYNVSLNSTNYCSGHRAFSLGNASWIDLAINASGYVYSPNTSAFPSESLASPSSWPYQGQLVLMPTVSGVNIPVKKSWEPYQANPLEVYVNKPGQSVLNGTWLGDVFGNASAKGGYTFAQAKTAPGYAIYLTSCSINNVSVQNCSINTETVNSTLYNYTCQVGSALNNCNQYAPPGFGGVNWGCLNPLEWGTCISNWANGLVGAMWAPLVEILTVLIIIVILIAVLIVASKFLGVSRNGGGMR